MGVHQQQRETALAMRSRGKVLRASYPFASHSSATVIVPMPFLEVEFLVKEIIKAHSAFMQYSQEPHFGSFFKKSSCFSMMVAAFRLKEQHFQALWHSSLYAPSAFLCLWTKYKIAAVSCSLLEMANPSKDACNNGTAALLCTMLLTWN